MKWREGEVSPGAFVLEVFAYKLRDNSWKKCDLENRNPKWRGRRY
jgi:hypothetical protein